MNLESRYRAAESLPSCEAERVAPSFWRSLADHIAGVLCMLAVPVLVALVGVAMGVRP